MNDIRLPFAMRLDTGVVVGIDAVARGLSCECVCPGCRARVVAVKGAVYRHHFRHFAEDGACSGGRESALHLFAKQVICRELLLYLPTHIGEMRSAREEVWLDGIKPDVLASYDSEDVAVEIFVTHRVSRDKLEKIYARELTSVEIDLSYYRDVELTEGQLRDVVIRIAPRRWLFDPLSIRRQRQLDAEAEEAAGQEIIRNWKRLEAEAAQAKEAKVREEAEHRARVAALAAELARARAAERAEQARLAELSEARRREEAERRLGPSLQKLVAAHGTYPEITPEAWERYWSEKARFLDRLRHGETP